MSANDTKEKGAGSGQADSPSSRSLVGLNAANFFLAEITGVVMPFLGRTSRARAGRRRPSGWRFRWRAWASFSCRRQRA